MKTPSSTACTRFAILLLAGSGSLLAQTQSQPSVTYDPVEDEFVYLWETNRNRTFFPQSSLDLGSWDYFGALHFGPGSHVGRVQNNAAKGFFRLQYSDLPVATESEAETADFDRDGLTNLYELQESHTDPLVADTDGDSLPDGWEVAHSISPLDDGSIDPQNGPDGVFPDSSPTSGPVLFSVTTNADAYLGGIQDHPGANFRDLDGDGLVNEIDAGMHTRAINWITHHSAPHFVYRPIAGYNSVSHGLIRGCNNNGDVIAQRAVYSNGTWNLLGTLPIGEEDYYLPLSVQVDGRTHRAYVVHQPTATSISDTGVIVGTGTVRFETIEEDTDPNFPIYYDLPSTTFSFVWDSWNATPRILGHAANAVLSGSYWDELAQISGDNVVIIRRRAVPTSATDTRHQFQRISPYSGQSGTTGAYNVYVISSTGERGLQAFSLAGFANGFCWLPENSSPVSVMAESTFKTSNSRTYFGFDPIYAGMTPGTPGSYCLNFWDKTMIRHEGRWQEAIEMGDATLVTKKGVAVRSKAPTDVNLWQGGQTISLIDAVANKNFTGSYIFPNDSTTDGRILINHFSLTEADSYGFLVPIDIERVLSNQIPGSYFNNLPSPYFKGYANNPIIMGTSTLQQANLRVKVSHADSQIYVGAREVGTTAILGSAPATSEFVDLAFNVPSYSKSEYEIVAGFDADSNSALDPGEARVVFEKTPRADVNGNAATSNLEHIDKIVIVDSDQVHLERAALVGLGNILTTDYTGDLLEAFTTGSTSVAGSSTLTGETISWNQAGLSHPVGARWNSAGEDTTHRLIFADGSEASNDVEVSNAMEQAVGGAIVLNKTALLNAHSGGDDYITSPPLNFTEEIDFKDTDPAGLPEGIPELWLAFGKVTFKGTVRVTYKKSGTFLLVNAVEVIGSFDDVYDFSWGGGSSAGGLAGRAALVQAAHATLAPSATPNSGKVFFTRVQFNTGFTNSWNGTY